MLSTHRIAATLASSRGLFLTAVLGGSLFGLGFLGIGGASSAHVVTADFGNAEGLVAGNEVRIAGVAEGSVNDVNIHVDPSTGRQYAVVDFTVGGAFWPLHQGTHVAVKPKGVLSNVYLEVDPGPASSRSMGDQPFFPVSATRSPVNLDEFTNLFTPNVRTAIRTQLEEGVLAFGAGGASSLNQTLLNANPLTLDAIPVTDVLALRSPQLDRLNFEFDTITGDLAREDANLRALIPNMETTLAGLAAQQVSLQGTLQHADSVFADFDTALSDPATQADLAHVMTAGPNALTCASTLSTYLSPLVSAVNPYIAYKQPFNLNALLNDFITASGYNLLAVNDEGFGSGSTASGTTITVTLPPDLVADDEIILNVTELGSAPPSAPGYVRVASAGVNGMETTVMRHTLTGPESAVTVTFPSAVKAEVTATAYRGVDPVHPVDAIGQQTAPASKTVLAPSLTPKTPIDELVVAQGAIATKPHSLWGTIAPGINERVEANSVEPLVSAVADEGLLSGAATGPLKMQLSKPGDLAVIDLLLHPAVGIDTLRVVPIVGLPGYTTQDTGGLSNEHRGFTNTTVANGRRVYEEQPPNTDYPVLAGGCAPPAGLPR